MSMTHSFNFKFKNFASLSPSKFQSFFSRVEAENTWYLWFGFFALTSHSQTGKKAQFLLFSLDYFPKAVVNKLSQAGWQKMKEFILSRFWRPEVWKPCASQAWLSLTSLGQTDSFRFSPGLWWSWQSVPFLDLRKSDSSLCLWFLVAVSPLCDLCLKVLLFTRMAVIALRPTLIQYDFIFILSAKKCLQIRSHSQIFECTWFWETTV